MQCLAGIGRSGLVGFECAQHRRALRPSVEMILKHPRAIRRRQVWRRQLSDFLDSPLGGVRPVHQMSTCRTELTLGPHVVQIWSRNVRKFERTKT